METKQRSVIREGTRAPLFALRDKDGTVFSLAAGKDDFTVLYFYPKDSTPGCTIEAQEFSRALKEFKSRKAAVIGISGGDERSKEKFCAKYALSVPLVSDTDFKVSKAYGVYGQKKFMGRTFNGIHRKTFVIDKHGVVVKVFSTVKPEGHAEEVLAALDQLRSSVAEARSKSAPKKRSHATSTKRPTAKKATKKTPITRRPRRKAT